MKADHLDFYFDYLSPFSYFAWLRMVELCNSSELALRAHPVVFGKLLDHWGQLGPAEIPPKREWLYKYCYRYAHIQGIEFNPPKYHPFNPLAALRLSLADVCEENQQSVITAIFEAGWSQGKDIGDVNELIATLGSRGIDANGWSEQINQSAIKALLTQETRDAIAKGVFGVPTTIVEQQLFWGNDQHDHISLYVAGDDCLDEDKVAQILARPRAIDRKALK